MRALRLIVVASCLLLLTGCLLIPLEPDPQSLITYEEEFDNPASYSGAHVWYTHDSDASVVWIADGAIQILVHEDEYFQSSFPAGVETGDVFRLDIGACKVAGPQSSEYGVIFRRQDGDSFLRFTITGDGMMRFRKRLNGSWSDIVALTPSSAINQGADCNQITVIADGPDFEFYVNEVLVLESSDASFQGGSIGVIAANPAGNDGVHAAFPIVILTELE